MRPLLFIALLAACGSESAAPVLQIDVKTDYVPREDFDAIRVQVGDGDLRTNLEHIVDPSGDYARGRRIGSTTTVRGDVLVTAELIRDGGMVARREVIATIEAAINAVTIVITRDCSGVMCPFPGGDAALRSCYGGLCADPRCTVETPEFCPSACMTNEDCSPSGCRRAYCDMGACFSVPDDGACAEGERCRSDGMCAADIDGGVDGGVMDGGVVDVGVDAGCVMGERVCMENTLRECTATGWVESLCETACDGAMGCVDLAPSNLTRPIPPVGMQRSVVMGGTWDTTACEDIEGYWYVETVAGDINLCVLFFEHVTFSDDLRVVGSRGLVVVSATDILVEGRILADAEGPVRGPGGGRGSAQLLEGADGANVSTFSDGGGAGGGGFSRGGRGGRGGSAAGGAAGSSHAAEYRLSPLTGGGDGGDGGSGASAGGGGGGGGAVQLSARGDIIVTGTIDVSGGAGGGGGDVAANTNIGAGGGGGGGGSLLLEAAGNIHVDNGQLILANGGGGGGACGCFNLGPGEDGREDPPPTGGDGGRLCPGDSIQAATGGDGSEDSSRGENGEDDARMGYNGGGGGGGSGIVVIRSTSTSGVLDGSGHRIIETPTLQPVP